ncbi:cell division protein FtsL [Brucella sp. IR073]|uniref:cell division protein FtsL n=1 Tax=unclassified Brucella TaxID=2632610 RepID=UPI003B97DAF3
MLRTFDIILITIMLAAATVTYKIKYDAEKRMADIRVLQRKIDFEKDTITLLKADWSLLTQPNRLQKLSEIYRTELNLAPIDPHQIVSIDDVPERAPDDIENIISSSDELLAVINQTDSMKTGSVEQGQ